MTPRIYYGWWIVAICLTALLITAGLGFYSIGVFFNPLMVEFGWTRTQVSGIVSVYWAAIAVAGPFVGRFLDTHGAPKTMLWGVIGSGGFLSLLGLTQSLPYFYGVYALVALSHTALSIPYGYLISRWFYRKRGMAMGFATAGIGLGGLVISPVANALITAYGWRQAYLFLGLGVMVVMLPLLLLVRNGPEEMGLFPDGENQDTPAGGPRLEPGWTASQALKTPLFWAAALGLFLVYGTVFGTLSHQVPLLRDLGLTPAKAASMLGFTAGMGVLGKLLFGYLMDKLNPRLVISSCFMLQALGVFILIFVREAFGLWVFVCVFGFSMGGTATLRPLIVVWLFGIGSYGTIFGVIQVFQSMGSALFPLVGGMIFDATGSYRWAFLLFGFSAALAGILYSVLPRPEAVGERV